MRSGKKNFKGLWLTITLTALTIVFAVVYIRLTRFTDVSKDRFLLIIAVIFVVATVTAVVWAGRRKAGNQEANEIDRHRRTQFGREATPSTFAQIYEQINSSLRSRRYYEQNLLSRISQLHNVNAGGKAGDEHPPINSSPAKSGISTMIWDFLSGKKVTGQEIQNELDCIEDK